MVFAALGRALIEDGRVAAGIDTLRLALVNDWNPRLFGEVAEHEVAQGDSSRARTLWARVAADPGTSPAIADSLRTRAIVSDSRWEEAVANARAEMHRIVLSAADSIVLPTVLLSDGDQTPASLSALADGRMAVVVFWSLNCAPSRASLPQIQRLHERLSDSVRVITIVREQPSPELSALLTSGGHTLQVLHDADGSARQAFNSWSTPSYYIVDANGSLRFSRSTPAQLLRQVDALRR